MNYLVTTAKLIEKGCSYKAEECSGLLIVPDHLSDTSEIYPAAFPLLLASLCGCVSCKCCVCVCALTLLSLVITGWTGACVAD